MNAADPFIDWLLAAKTPSIRWRTLTGLLGRPATDPDVAAARRAIMTAGPVPHILAGQDAVGSWQGERGFYTPKYTSSHWSLMLLTELWVDPEDKRFQRGVDHLLDTFIPILDDRLATNTLGLVCLFGNVLRYALYAGRGDHPAVARLVDYAVRDIGNGFCRCVSNTDHPCAWGVVRALWGLATLPAADRPAGLGEVAAGAVGFLLEKHSLLAADYPVPDDGRVSDLWRRLNFPLFYQADTLFTLRILAEWNALDHPGARPALDWLAGRRSATGRWRGASPYRQRTWPLGPRAETDRWVSLQAAMILQPAGRLRSLPT